jgi:hypothetical protein
MLPAGRLDDVEVFQFQLIHLNFHMYQRLQLQFYVLLMMGAMDTRNM